MCILSVWHRVIDFCQVTFPVGNMEQLDGGDCGTDGCGNGVKMHDARYNLFIDIATSLVLDGSPTNQRSPSTFEGVGSVYWIEARSY